MNTLAGSHSSQTNHLLHNSFKFPIISCSECLGGFFITIIMCNTRFYLILSDVLYHKFLHKWHFYTMSYIKLHLLLYTPILVMNTFVNSDPYSSPMKPTSINFNKTTPTTFINHKHSSIMTSSIAATCSKKLLDRRILQHY